MNAFTQSKWFPVALLVIAGGLYLWTNQKPVTPDVPPRNGPNMLRAFRDMLDKEGRIIKRATRIGAEARRDAAQLGKFAKAMRGKLEEDWQRTPPYIKTGVEADNLRIFGRSVMLSGESLAPFYPELSPTLEAHFSDYVGKSGGPLDTERKQKWLEAWDSLAEGCAYAAEHL